MKVKMIVSAVCLTLCASGAFAFSMSGNWSESKVKRTRYTTSGNNNEGGFNNYKNNGSNTLAGTTQQAGGDELTVIQGGTGNSYVVNNAQVSGNAIVHQYAEFDTVTVEARGNGNKFYLNQLEVR